MRFTVEKVPDKYMPKLIHITVTNLSTGQHAITSCSRENSGKEAVKLKKLLRHHG